MYRPVVGTLGYILSPDGNKTLLVHRNARSDDHHLGKYNGLGGKLEPGEDVFSCLAREIREEAGIAVTEAILRGTVNWPGFGPDSQDWLGFIFLVTGFTGQPVSYNEEGDLAWHPVDSLLSLPMWEGDRYFIPLVFDGDPRIFHGHMPYENGRPLSWSYSRM
ncbi:NUDIX hydrolase [Desulfolithobacter sp.]